jgi:hypothetical protein
VGLEAADNETPSLQIGCICRPGRREIPNKQFDQGLSLICPDKDSQLYGLSLLPLLLPATVPSYDGFNVISTRYSTAFLAAISTDKLSVDPFLHSIFLQEYYEIVIWLKIYTQRLEIS